jgi:processive 1,2-diacylglycerol beta-glucosyltransferase
MIQLYDNSTGDKIGNLTQDQLQFLIDQLEETSSADQDYYIDQPTLEMLERAGCDPELLELLRSTLGNRAGLEVRWDRT